MALEPRSSSRRALRSSYGSALNTAFQRAAVALAKAGKIAVMTFYGVPDLKHLRLNTSPEKFKTYMQHLKDEGCTVIAMRDLGKYLH
jgi:hypothetical protein